MGYSKMNIHTTTIPDHFTDLLTLDPPRITPTRFAHRVRFVPVGEKGPGIYAPVPVPNEGFIHSLAVKLKDADPTGHLIVSPIDPAFHYDGFFLYAILDDVPVAAQGPKLWRAVNLHGAAYSTIQANQGFLYLLIPDGPTGEILADVAITARTD